MRRADEVIEKMYAILSDIKQAADKRIEIVNEEAKEEIKQLYDRTRLVMYKSIEKVQEVSKDLPDNEEVEAFFFNILKKCNEVKEFTIDKINQTGNAYKPNLNMIQDEITNLFEEFREHEAYKTAVNAYDSIKQNVQDYLAKPEVQEKISQLKDKTLDIADKGLDILKKTLKPEEYKEEHK